MTVSTRSMQLAGTAGLLAALLAAAACDINARSPVAADTSGGGSGGSSPVAGGGGSGGSGGAGVEVLGAGELPVPSGPGDVARPSGAVGKLKVLPWAGFKSATTYTFDDAQPSQLDHWPELKATGARMTFYINTWMKGSSLSFDSTWKEALAGGSEIANHTVHHCKFDEACNGAAAGSSEAELDEVNEYIEGTLGAPPARTMAYPFGDTGYQAAVEARFFLARGVVSGLIAPGGGSDPFNLPTFAANGGESVEVFDGAIDQARTQGGWVIFLFHSILPTSQNWYAGVEIDAITGSIAHAQKLGDVWLDSLVQVGAYWLGQRVLEGATSVPSGKGTTWTWTLPEHFPPGRFLRVTVDGGTLAQGGAPLSWNGHGYYEVALDAGALTLSP